MNATGKMVGFDGDDDLWPRDNPFKDQYGRPTRSEAGFRAFLDEALLVDLQSTCIRAGLSATLPPHRLRENLINEFRRYLTVYSPPQTSMAANGRTKEIGAKIEALKTPAESVA